MDRITDEFLRSFYKLHPKSDWFFRVTRTGNADKSWLKPDYASSGLQSVNTRTFRDAWIHPRGSSRWGWRRNYVDVLSAQLRNKRIPLLHLLVWIERNTPFPDEFSREDAISAFSERFCFSGDELSALFDRNVASKLSEKEAFQQVPVSWNEIIGTRPMPPDVGPDALAMLRHLSLQSLGPIQSLQCSPATRLNLITGDNGVGKTFFLDTTWWALTNEWVESPILPRAGIFQPSHEPTITFQFAATVTRLPQTARYTQNRGWIVQGERDLAQSLVLYCRSDGAFSVWDPARDATNGGGRKLDLGRSDLWYGKLGANGNLMTEGLLRDLVSWQAKEEHAELDLFTRALARLSPPEMPILLLGRPMRVNGISHSVPTLTHAYGDVPLVHESAGIKRMVALAYLIVWAWLEHKTLADQNQKPIAAKLVLLVDELEAHLHPKWQRTVLPSLLGVLSDLSSSLDSQIFVATHSPFVTASMEGSFREESDRFFTLDINSEGVVSFRELEFRPRGPVDVWLTSPAFGLKDARSVDAASAIRKAVALQDESEPSPIAVKNCHKDLVRLLPSTDRFWPRWVLFAKRYGVEI